MINKTLATRRPSFRLSVKIAVFLSVVFLTGAFTFSLVSFAGKETAGKVRKEIPAETFIQSQAGQLFQAGEYQRSLDAIDALLENYPGDPLLRRYRAMALSGAGRYDEAISILKDLLSENPTHLPTQYFLGQVYEASGSHQLALKHWRWVADQEEGSVYELWARDALEVAGEAPIKKPVNDLLRWYVVARYGYEYDSNVILLPDDKSLSSSRDKNAGRHLLDLAIRYRAYSSRDTAVDLTYAVRQSFLDDSLDEFNFHSEEFGLNLRHRVQIGDKDVVLGARYEFLMGFLDEDLFSIRNRWHLSADTRLTPRSRTVIYDRMTQSNFGPDGFDPSRTSRDGFQNDVGFTHYYYSPDYRSYLFFREEFNSTHSRGRNFDAVGTTTRVGAHVPLLKRLDLDASTGLQLGFYHDFSSVSVADRSRRRDIDWDLYTALTYYLTPRLGLRGFYRYINAWNQNNYYDYSRHVGGVELIYNRYF